MPDRMKQQTTAIAPRPARYRRPPLWPGLLLAVPLLAGGGCASIGPPVSPEDTRVERPDAPPEYDYMVGLDLELEGRLDEAFAAYQRAHVKDPDSAYLLRKLAELAARRAALDEALRYGEEALALQPDAPELRLFLATLHRFRKDPTSAQRLLVDEAGIPISPEAAILLYNIQIESGRFEEALATAEWLREQEPDSHRSLFALAQAYHRVGRAEEAEALLRQALQGDEDDLPVYDYLARLRRQADDREGELAVYEEVLGHFPHHFETLMRKAEALDALGRDAETRAVLEELEGQHNDQRATMRLGFLDLRDGLYPQAAARFERVLEGNPRQYEVAYLLGIVRRRMGQDDAAVAAFESVPPGHERFVDARTQIAGVFESRGDFEGALAQVELARQHQRARPLDLYTASLRAKAGDFDGAVEFLEGLLEEAPDDPEVLYNLGVIYGEAGRSGQAIEYMETVLSIDPKHAGALNYIGYTWAEQGIRLDEAEDFIVRALEARPDDGYITDSLGWVYYMRARPLIEAGDLAQGRPLLERSIRELERASKLTGGDPVISEHLGDAYLLLDNKRRALENYEDALEQEPREAEQPNLRSKAETLRRELGVE
jgi:tetratricopeptide (TPR) repeat protein